MTADADRPVVGLFLHSGRLQCGLRLFHLQSGSGTTEPLSLLREAG